MGLFSFLGGKDWNIVAVTYEAQNTYRLNANRRKGSDADKAMKGAQAHSRTICWMVFNQKGSKLHEGLGPFANKMAPEEANRILQKLQFHRDVLGVLQSLEGGRESTSRTFNWD